MKKLQTFEPKGLVSFPIDSILDNSTTDFDLFLGVSDHLVLYSQSGYKWLKDEITYLLRGGHTHFFIRSQDEKRVHMYKQISTLPLLDFQAAPESRIQAIESVGSLFIKYLYEGELSPGCVAKAELLSGSLVQCIEQEPGCIKVLSGLREHDTYTYNHSMRVAAYSTAIALKMGLSDSESLKKIALGSIFHDIGKKSVPLQIIHKPGALTDAEWQAMQSHPWEGFELLKASSLSHPSLEIVLHHHEKLDGSGYPHGLDKNSLLPEVQIATVADVFDALTSSRSYQQHRSRFEALDLMKHKFLGTKIPPDAFAALVASLAS